MNKSTFVSESRTFELLVANKKVLELMANNRPLQEILDSVVRLIETFASGCISTAYFVVDGTLRMGAAPSFPESFVQAVDGCPTGFNQGTCGHAAFTGKRAISTDVSIDEVWGPFREWILSYGIKAAWSTPVISENGEVLATVSMCWKETRVPTEWDFEIVDAATSLMRIAVERKKQEEIIEEQRLKLAINSRLAALGEMAACLAHEINNPLAIIQGHSNLLQLMSNSSSVTSESVKKAAVDIEKTVTRIAGIIKGLKTISKDGENDPFETIEMGTLIEETISFCRERFNKNNVTLTYEYPSDAIHVECRLIQISQTLLNVLNNAFDAVIVSTEKWVKVNLNLKEETCILTITDSGIGVPPELRHKIMNPFFTTKNSYQGTGLGLSIAKKIIESHKGKFSLKEDTANTCFEIILPLKQISNV